MLTSVLFSLLLLLRVKVSLWRSGPNWRTVGREAWHELKKENIQLRNPGPAKGNFYGKSKITEHHVFGIKGGYGKITENIQKYHAKVIRKSCKSCRNHTENEIYR